MRVLLLEAVLDFKYSSWESMLQLYYKLFTKKRKLFLKPFLANIPILYTLKTPENLWNVGQKRVKLTYWIFFKA